MLSPELIRRIRRIEIKTRHLVADSFAGEYHAIFKGRGMAFDEVRPYQPGDEVRSIDWNVTARVGEPYVKRYVEERELTVMLLVDSSASLTTGSRGRAKRELAAELAAVLAFSATTNNDRVGLIQFAGEVTGLPGKVFRPKVDSTFALGCGQTTGSRATLFAGRAVKSAAQKLKVDLDKGMTLRDLVGNVYAADIVIDDTTALGAEAARIKTHTAFGYATQVCILDDKGKIERFIAAHDVGRAINPALCSGQIEGSIHMGLGYALTEELPCDNGMPVTFKLREIGVLRARDMPKCEVILVEDPEPEGPFGAKGVGEIGLVPTAGAVAGALAAFDGVRRFELPMKDSPAAKAVSVGRIKGDRTQWT